MKRLVVKIGSSTLVRPDGRIDRERMASLAAQVAAVRDLGWQTVLVSSGAIACGLERLGMDERPNDMAGLQAAASVGQGALVGAYEDAFAAHGIVTSLVLLTRRDTADRQAYLHARDTFSRLLELGVVPVVNENDTVSVEQIRFGDNDTLCALVSCLVGADLAVILSDVEGLYSANPQVDASAQLIERVERITPDIAAIAGDAGSKMGSGGMITKISAARVLGIAGIPLVICSGTNDEALPAAVQGKPVGTLFAADSKPHEITPRKLWIALGDSARGALIIDAGAKKALVSRGSSLLAVGLKGIEGSFDEGDVVDIKDEAGLLVARGLVGASSDAVELACGKSSAQLMKNSLLAELADKAVVHRDDLVVFE